MQSQQWNLLPPSGAGFDIFSSAFDLDSLEPIAGSSTEDLMYSSFDHGLLDIDGWDHEPARMAI